MNGFARWDGCRFWQPGLLKAGPAAGLALGLLALMPHDAVHAQARGESVQDMQERLDIEPAHPATIEELDAWLRRLVGRFLVVEPITKEPIARVDCASIGSGPGLQCASRFIGRRVNRDTPGPAFQLWGIDPDLPGIRILRVSGISVADHVEGGKLRSDKVVFASACPLPPNVPGGSSPFSCWHQTIFDAPPESDTLIFREYREVRFLVKRSGQASGGGTSGSASPTSSFSGGSRQEWRRLADNDVSEPVVMLESKELDALEEYGKGDIPQLVGHVADQARKLTPAQRDALESQLAAYEAETSHRVIVAIVNRLNGQPIEAFSRRAAVTWQLDNDERSNYVLIELAPNDGAVRIEPGAGLRECIPDATAQQILDEAMIPELRYQRFSEGLHKGAARVMDACREFRMEEVVQ